MEAQMKTIIASLICAVVAIGCIGLAPSKAEAGWYGRGVGVSIRIGPRYGYRPYGYYGYRYRPYGYYGYRRYGYYGYRPHRGYWAGRAYRRWR
jgi:hypothetical protein